MHFIVKTLQSTHMSDKFTRDVIKIVIAKAAQRYGFETISTSALNIFVDAVIARLSDYARFAAKTTAHCGRTDSHAYDVFISLARFNETPETLVTWLNDSPAFPIFEYLIDPYPYPKENSTLYKHQKSNNVIPFRANMGTGEGHIPAFFPPKPSAYTYDQTFDFDSTVDSREEVAKRRERAHNQIKQSLNRVLAGKGADAPHAVRFDSELTRLVTNELGQMDPINEPTLLHHEGRMRRVDPEDL